MSDTKAYSNKIIGQMPSQLITSSDQEPLPNIWLEVDGKSLLMLLDTGSVCSLISTKNMDRQDTRLHHSDLIFYAVNGSTIPIYGMMCFNVIIGANTIQHTFYVADVDFNILGNDFFTKHMVSRWTTSFYCYQ